MRDLINKHILMEQLKNARENGIKDDFKKGLLEAERLVINMPVENRQTGHWIAKNHFTLVCSNCKFNFSIMKCDFFDKMNYCPNCGADMRGDE